MDVAAILTETESLSVEDRLQLVEAIWDSIAADAEQLPLSDAQRHELERRLADDLAHPDQGVPWEEVRAQALARLRRPTDRPNY